MAPPIFTPDGTEVEEVIMPDGSEASEVIAPDGAVVFNAIPDSEADQKLVHRWVLNDVNGTVEDSIGNADGSVDSAIDSVSGPWAGGSAAENESGDNRIDTQDQLSAFVNSLDSGGAIAFSIKTTASEGVFIGSEAHTEDNEFMFYMETDGVLRISYSPDTGRGQITEDTGDWNDGDEHRVVWNDIDLDSDTADCWVDQSELSTTTQTTGGAPDPNKDIRFFGDGSGSLDLEPYVGVIDDICMFDETLTDSEIQSYQNPW